MLNDFKFTSAKTPTGILHELDTAGKILRAANSELEVLNYTIQIFEKLGFERIRIWMLDGEKKEFRGGKCNYVDDEKFRKIRGPLSFKKDSPYQTHALSKKEPFINRKNLLLKKFFKDYKTKVTIEFPLVSGKQTIGSIGVDNEISKTQLDLKKIEPNIIPFVNHVALVLSRVKAEEKIREANRNLKKRISEATTELQFKNIELEKLANFDDLSGLPNRRYFERRLADEFKKTGSRKSLSLAMMDIDFLKHLNDTRGHAAGDRLIVKIGEILKNDRRIDFAARFAGDEFIFFLLGKSNLDRNRILKNVLRKIKKATGQSVSIGCVSAASLGIQSTIDMVRLADDALYHAKHTGRNRFVCADEEHEKIVSLAERRFDLQEIEQQGTFAADYIRQLKAINKISESLRRSRSEKVTLQKVVRNFHDALDFKRAGAYIEDENSKAITLAASSGFDKKLVDKIVVAKKYPRLNAWLKKVMYSRKAQKFENKSVPPVLRKLFGMSRVLAVPLIGRTLVMGVIFAEYESNRVIHKSDLDFFLTIGDQIETGLVKLRALNEARQFNKKLRREVSTATQKLKKYTDSLEKEIQSNISLRNKEQRTHFELISALVTSLEEKDIYTRGHSVRVASYAVKLGRQCDMEEARLRNLRYAGLLHDVGKVAIDQTILHKQTALTEGETRELEKHPVIGEKIVSGLKFLESAAQTIRHHHEKWDGTGYPDSLKRKDIELEARILTIADSYDAMVTRRSYGKKMTREEAIRELKLGSGKQFDPKLVRLFIQLLRRGKIRAPQKKSTKKSKR